VIKPAVERRSSDELSTQLIDDGPVGHALSVHLRRAKLITRCDDRPTVAKFLKSRVWGKVLEERTLVLEVGYRHFLITQRGIGGSLCAKTSWILAVVSLQHRLVTDAQTDRQTHAHS